MSRPYESLFLISIAVFTNNSYAVTSCAKTGNTSHSKKFELASESFIYLVLVVTMCSEWKVVSNNEANWEMVL